LEKFQVSKKHFIINKEMNSLNTWEMCSFLLSSVHPRQQKDIARVSNNMTVNHLKSISR
jgi:hypothetical protein